MWLAMTLAYHRAGFGRLLVRSQGHGVYDDITQPLPYSAHNCLSLCVCHLFTSFSLSYSERRRCHNSNMYFTAFTFQNLGILVYAVLGMTSHNDQIQPNITMFCQCYAYFYHCTNSTGTSTGSMTAFQTSHVNTQALLKHTNTLIPELLQSSCKGWDGAQMEINELSLRPWLYPAAQERHGRKQCSLSII